MAGGPRFRTRIVIGCALVCWLVGACGEGTAGLIGRTWRWTALTEDAPLAHSEVSTPDLYTLTFSDDGSFRAQADCNTVAGTFVTDGHEITISPGPSTLVACPEGSLADRYVSLLHTVSTFSVDGDDLTLRFEDDAGKMMFAAAV